MSNKNDTVPIFTIGHPTRSIADFVDLLRVGEVEEVIDVRAIPRSRTNPDYNVDRLPAELWAYQIRHRYIAALSGLRKRVVGAAPEVNGLWRNKSFHNYADYALTERFRDGLRELLEASAKRRCAIMCAEAVWWQCHRRIIADYLIILGHLMSPGRGEKANITPGADWGWDRPLSPAWLIATSG